MADKHTHALSTMTTTVSESVTDGKEHWQQLSYVIKAWRKCSANDVDYVGIATEVKT